MIATAHRRARARRPLLGLRRHPGRLALAAMRVPRPLYHHGWGWLLDHTFLLIAHQGRKTGRRRETVAMALAYDPETREAVVFSAWGPNTEWIRNLRADESIAMVREFQRRHPWRTRLFAAILGWGDLRSETAVRRFVRSRPFVSFRAGDQAPPPSRPRGGWVPGRSSHARASTRRPGVWGTADGRDHAPTAMTVA